MKHSKEIMFKYFLPLAISFFGNLWLFTVSVSGNQTVYRIILIILILTSLFIALKNIWQLLPDIQKVKVFSAILLFAIFFNGLIISLKTISNIITLLLGILILYIFGRVFVKYMSKYR